MSDRIMECACRRRVGEMRTVGDVTLRVCVKCSRYQPFGRAPTETGPVMEQLEQAQAHIIELDRLIEDLCAIAERGVEPLLSTGQQLLGLSQLANAAIVDITARKSDQASRTPDLHIVSVAVVEKLLEDLRQARATLHEVALRHTRWGQRYAVYVNEVRGQSQVLAARMIL